MKKIIALHFELLKNPQHFNVADFIKAAIILYALADGKYSKFITKFFAAFDTEDASFQKYDRKTLTARIAKQNNDRTVKFRLLREVIVAFVRTAGEQKTICISSLKRPPVFSLQSVLRTFFPATTVYSVPQ